ncbi:F-box protein [Hirschfeldia incana]|nr:F-box protein [Hirschfeldia incana]
MKRHSSSSSATRKLQHSIVDDDCISKLPDDLLRMILSELSSEEAVKTILLSSRWKDLWKRRPHFVLDMKRILDKTPIKLWHKVSAQLASSMDKTFNEHRGELESCIITSRCDDDDDRTLQNWIRRATRLKHTKDLTLNDIPGSKRRFGENHLLQTSAEIFSHHSLTSLSLSGYSLLSTHGFNNCGNLKTLKLSNMMVTQFSTVSSVLAACSSLEVVVLQMAFLAVFGVLTIEHENLKFLQVDFPYYVQTIQVNAPRLDVLDIRDINCEGENDFIVTGPNNQFNRNHWVTRRVYRPHISYNVSELAQETKNIWHELLMSDFRGMTARHGTLSVSLDITNPKEVGIFKELLLMWTTYTMIELEILFKTNNAPREEDGECSNEILWEDANPFPSAGFRVYQVWMYNFKGSSKEEFAFASRFVTQKTVMMKMMIETSLYPPMKKLEVEAAVAKLMELPKGNEDLSIECF